MPAVIRRAGARRHASAPREEGAALLAVLLVMLVLAVLSLLVLANLLRETRPTGFAQSSSKSLFAAEAGLQASLAQVRTAVSFSDSDEVFGDRSKLPCAITGSVGATDQVMGYEVGVDYYATDPARMTQAERETKKIVCNPASGPVATPFFALLTSRGTTPSPAGANPLAQPAPRTLQSVYSFRVANQNVLGGLMYTVTQKACLQADSESAGAKVRYVAASACVSGTPTQMWVYAKDYAIKLGSTIGTSTGGAGAELCLTGSSGEVTLQPCATLKADQLWSYEGGAHFRGQNSTNTDYGGACLWSGNKNADPSGSFLQVGSDGCGASNQEWGSWNPEPRVGAGAASYATHQIVNFLEFGRCFDVTGQTVTWPFMIAYPCKQDPSGGSRLAWNHKWYYTEPTDPVKVSAPQTITVKENNTRELCLQTPAISKKPAYVTLTECSGAAAQRYVRRTDTGSSLTSYTFRTSDDRCLSTGPQADASGVKWSTLVAATCTGGSEQKWNAPPTLENAAVTSTRELPTTGG